MRVIKLTEKNRREVLGIAAIALQKGKVVVYPTDTSYGLGASVKSPAAVAKIYKIKGREEKKPIHIFVPSIDSARKYVQWNLTAQKLAKKFLPGPLSIALPLKNKSALIKKLSAGTGFLGIRIAGNKFALELAKKAGPITATSANLAGEKGGFDSYSAEDIIRQFKDRKYKPDIIIDEGVLPHTRPSTFVRISPKSWEILRKGPISEKQIREILK